MKLPSELVLSEEGKIDQRKMNLLGRLGGSWYCHTQTNNLFELSQPMQKTLGYDRFFNSRYLEKFFPGWKLNPTSKSLVRAQVSENFADGRKPGRKGLAKRSGVDCKQSVTKLRSIAKNSSGERQRMAHWCANMKSGRKDK